MKSILKYVIGIALVGVFIWTLFYLFQKSKPKEISYETTTITLRDIVKKSMATGSIVPKKEIEIKSTVSGIIEEIYVKPGDLIEKGDVIAKIKLIPDMLSLNNAESRVEKATVYYDDAKTIYNRQLALFEKGVIAESTMQETRLSYKNAKLELEAAEDQLQLIKEGVTKKNGKNTNTLIKSTIAGMVLDVPVEEGFSVMESSTFNAGTTIASVANMNEMLFVGKVDETEIGKVLKGMSLVISIGAIENKTYKGVLTEIAPKGVEDNGAILFEIKADIILDKNSFIRAGYSANADIVLEERKQVLSIDESVLQFDKDKPFVEILTDSTKQLYKKAPIKVGLSDGIYIEVISGVKKGEQIKNPSGIIEK